MKWRDGITERTFLLPDSKGHVFLSGRCFRGDEPVRSRKREELRKLIYEWIGSGGEFNESPQSRNLHGAPNCHEAVAKFLRRHKIITVVGAREPRIECWFVGIKPSDEVGHIFTMFLDSPLATRLHICRYCKHLFIKNPQPHPYVRGICCSEKCTRGRNNTLAKKARDASQREQWINEQCGWYYKGMELYRSGKLKTRADVARWMAKQSGSSQTKISRNWKEIES